jgi:hypothetical protein
MSKGRSPLVKWAGLVLAGLMAAVVGALAEVVAHHYNWSWDLTSAGRFSLDRSQVDFLEGLDREVDFLVFHASGRRGQYQELLEGLRRYNRRVSYRLVHLDSNPGLAELRGVRSYGQTVVTSGERRVVLPRLTRESALKAAAVVTSPRRRRIMFTVGHGEHTLARGYGRLGKVLHGEGWAPQPLDLSRGVPPGPAPELVVVAGPARDFSAGELQALDALKEAGSSLLFMLEPFTKAPELVAYCRKLGAVVGRDIVVDPDSKLFAGDRLIPLAQVEPGVRVWRGLDKPAALPTCSTVGLETRRREGRSLVLARTGPKSWGTDDQDWVREGGAFEPGRGRRGPLPVVAAVDAASPGGARLAFVGDSDFARNDFLGALANQRLFTGLADWLAGSPLGGGSNRPAPLNRAFHLTGDQAGTVILVSLVLAPGLSLLVGICWLVRRRWKA